MDLARKESFKKYIADGLEQKKLTPTQAEELMRRYESKYPEPKEAEAGVLSNIGSGLAIAGKGLAKGAASLGDLALLPTNLLGVTNFNPSEKVGELIEKIPVVGEASKAESGVGKALEWGAEGIGSILGGSAPLSLIKNSGKAINFLKKMFSPTATNLGSAVGANVLANAVQNDDPTNKEFIAPMLAGLVGGMAGASTAGMVKGLKNKITNSPEKGLLNKLLNPSYEGLNKEAQKIGFSSDKYEAFKESDIPFTLGNVSSKGDVHTLEAMAVDSDPLKRVAQRREAQNKKIADVFGVSQDSSKNEMADFLKDLSPEVREKMKSAWNKKFSSVLTELGIDPLDPIELTKSNAFLKDFLEGVKNKSLRNVGAGKYENIVLRGNPSIEDMVQDVLYNNFSKSSSKISPEFLKQNRKVIEEEIKKVASPASPTTHSRKEVDLIIAKIDKELQGIWDTAKNQSDASLANLRYNLKDDLHNALAHQASLSGNVEAFKKYKNLKADYGAYAKEFKEPLNLLLKKIHSGNSIVDTFGNIVKKGYEFPTHLLESITPQQKKELTSYITSILSQGEQRTLKNGQFNVSIPHFLKKIQDIHPTLADHLFAALEKKGASLENLKKISNALETSGRATNTSGTARHVNLATSVKNLIRHPLDAASELYLKLMKEQNIKKSIDNEYMKKLYDASIKQKNVKSENMKDVLSKILANSLISASS